MVSNKEFLVNIFTHMVSFLRKMKFDLPREYYKEVQKGHGQFKKSKSRADYEYAMEMSDDKLNYYDKHNKRPTIPEFRKLHIDNGKAQKKAKLFKGLDPKKIHQIYKVLDDRTRGSKLHPVHGIVFEPIKTDSKEINETELLNLSNDEDTDKAHSRNPFNSSPFFKKRERILASIHKKHKHESSNNDFENIFNFEDVDARELNPATAGKKEEESPDKKSKFARSEEIKEIFTKVDTKLSASDLKPLFLKYEALHPIKTDGGTNFDLDIDELIPLHYKRITPEALGAGMMNVVVPIHSIDENHFNSDIDMKFMVKQDDEKDKDIMDEIYEKRELQRQKKLKQLTRENMKETMNRVNPKIDYLEEFKSPNPKYQETPGDIANMPEMKYLFELL